MVKYSLSLILFLFLLTSCHRERYSLLIEAESFENLGGWVVDPQFVDQVGSTYLLAHGLGKPVKDSETRIILPASGRYHVWARTMDWAPGEWDSPGRFRIILTPNL